MGLRIEMLPADEGDALWVEWGDVGRRQVRRLLIDSGRRGAYRVIAERMRKDPSVALELFVVTHIDVDHILGAVPLLADDALSPDRLGEVWFNGLHHCEPSAPRDRLGGRDGSFLRAVIERGGYAWNESFGGAAIVVPDDGPLPVVELAAGMRITLLGPTRARLQALRELWLKELAKVDIDPKDHEAVLEALEESRTHQPDRLGDASVEQLLGRAFEPDRSVPNGSSIAFLAEHEGCAVLFAGDAFAPDLEDAVRRLLAERGKRRLELDAFKVSHHGSRRNCSGPLLDLLDCKRFLISTNGARHAHPDDETIAHLVSRPKRPQLYFNYRTPRNERWADRLVQRELDFVAYYPQAGAEGCVVDIPSRGSSQTRSGTRERRLGATIVDEADDETVDRRVGGALAPCRSYRVDVVIGGTEGQLLAEPVPPVAFDRPDGSAVLEVVFWDPILAPTPQSAPMRLPPKGISSTATFYFETTSEHVALRARIVVLHRQRVVQTGLLTCDADGPRFVVDARPRRTLSELRGSRGAASLVFDGEAALRSDAVEKTTALHLDRSDVDKLVQAFSARLEPLDLGEADPAADPLAHPELVDVLYRLALKGAGLHAAVARSTRDQPSVLDGQASVQVVSTREGDFFPAELLYRYAAPRERKLCEHARIALKEGRCADACPEGSAKKAHVCPLGFWGLSRVVERHARVPDGIPPDGAVLLREQRGDDGRPQLRPRTGPAVLGASSRAFTAMNAALSDVAKQLGAHVPDVASAKTWTEWVRSIASTKAPLLILLPHHKTVDGFEILEIGDTDLLAEHVDPDHVRAGNYRPIILLLGCETQLARISFESFTARFLEHGAAIVVSTIAGVLGRDAVRAAELLSAAFAKARPDAAISVGQAVLDVRRALLAEGRLTGLALTAYGDADWVLR